MMVVALPLALLQPMAVIAARCIAVSCVENDEHGR